MAREDPKVRTKTSSTILDDMKPIGVVFGGPSPEHDVSILTGLQAARALHESGDDVVCLYWGRAGAWHQVPPTTEPAEFLAPEIANSIEVNFRLPNGFAAKRRRRESPIELESILNCCHGGPGEDGSLSSLLRLAGIRVTGPSPQSTALVMDKLATTSLAREVGIDTIDTYLASMMKDAADAPDKPWVAKPRFGGSSLGVEANVEDLDTVRSLGRVGSGRSGMIVQPFLKGWHDINVSVRTYPSIQLSAIERPLRDGSGVYGYSDKYLTGGVGMDAAPRELPAILPVTVRQQVEEFTKLLVGTLALTGAPRVDYLWDGADRIKLCEVNAIPGAWGNHLWKEAGVDRLDLYRNLVEESMSESPFLPQWAGTTDGQALRTSGTIASKLA